MFIGGCAVFLRLLTLLGHPLGASAAVLVAVGCVVVSCIGGVFVGVVIANRRGFNPNALGAQPEFVVISSRWLMFVSVFSFVFAMLFHAATARALGNDVLLHQAYWYIGAPFVQVALWACP